MKLTSGLSKRYKKSFVLDEDGLRRIHGVLAKAAKDVTFPASVVFHIEREDDRYYETTDIDQVLSDPNIPGKLVTLVGIELRPTAEDPEKPSQHSDWNQRLCGAKSVNHIRAESRPAGTYNGL